MMIPEYHAIEIARQRRQEAEAAATRYRMRRAARSRQPLRQHVGLALIGAGLRLVPREQRGQLGGVHGLAVSR